MSNSWKSYLKEQLDNPKVKAAFEEEKKVLILGITLAKVRQREKLTQAEVAKRIGTSVPQVSRIERAPENVNVQTLMRYAHAIGKRMEVKFVSESGPCKSRVA